MTVAEPTLDPGEPTGTLRPIARGRVPISGAQIAAAVLVLVILAAILAPLIAPHSPTSQNLMNNLQSPSGDHWLGTDRYGRDVFSRLIYAARPSLLAAVQAVVIALACGVPLGLLAGHYGGRVDHFISWCNDVVMGFPALILAIAIVGVLGPGLQNAMLAIGIVLIPRALRVSRGVAIDLRHESFIEAARQIGSSEPRTVFRHVLPNTAPVLLVEVSLLAAIAMLAEAGLSFLGLGVIPPQPSWGNMLGEGFQDIRSNPWLIVWPGLAITITVMCLFAIGDRGRAHLAREGDTDGF